MFEDMLSRLGLRRSSGGPDAYFARPDVWKYVVSSNVAAMAHFSPVGKNDGVQPILGVRFKDGSEYRYFGVPLGVWLSMAIASSKGKFVWTDLRDRYAYKRVK